LAIGEDFSHFASRIGLPEAAHGRIDSPFDYPIQARIFLRRHMPQPQDPISPPNSSMPARPCSRRAAAAPSCCTPATADWRKAGSERLQARFPNPPFPVLVQGEAPREALLNRFRELGNAVLLATGSFWEGVT